MPDDTREALEAALWGCSTRRGSSDDEFKARLGKLADAIDARIAARVRALATGAEVDRARLTAERDQIAEACVAHNNEAERLKSDLSRARVALSNVSGALCDAGDAIVPADECGYVEAVRGIVGERDAAKAQARDAAASRQYAWERRDAATARIAELEGALLRARTSLVIMRCGAKGRDADGLDMSVTDIDAALTPSAAKPEPPEPAAKHVYYDEADVGCCTRCGEAVGHPSHEPAAKGDGAKCATCGGTWFVDGGEGGAMPSCPSCAAPAAGEQRWGVWKLHQKRDEPTLFTGTRDEAIRWAKTHHADGGPYHVRPLPPAAKGEE